MLISGIILMTLKCLLTTPPGLFELTLSFLTSILGDIQPLKAQLPGSLTRIVVNILEWLETLPEEVWNLGIQDFSHP